MATAADRDRFYQLLEEGITARRLAAGLPPIVRIKRSDLEKLAADRAVEARQQVGLDGDEKIIHPPATELRDRLGWPTSSVAGEIAVWLYLWQDPVRAMVDARSSSGALVGLLNSPQHLAVLTNPAWTHWGAGLHSEFKPGDDTSNIVFERYYGVVEFGINPPAPLDLPYDGFGSTYAYPVTILFEGGLIVGHRFAPDGRILSSKSGNWPKRSSATAGRRAVIPGQPGVWLLVINGYYANHWVREGSVFARAN